MLDTTEKGGRRTVNDNKNGVTTFGEWLLYLLLSSVSGLSFWVNILFIFVGKPNIKNYAKASLIWACIVFVIAIVFFTILIVGVGVGIGAL